MKLLIHVGLHRAASTSFEDWIEQHRQVLQGARCFAHYNLSSAKKEGSIFGILVGKSLTTIGPENAAELMLHELDERLGTYEAGIVSDENILGRMPGQPGRAFAALPPIAKVLRRIAEAHLIVPVVILRDHLSWLVSLYRIAQMRGDIRDFSEWSAMALPAPNPFRHLLLTLHAAVEPAQPVVTTLEAIITDQGRGFLSAIADAIGVELIKASTLPQRNVAPSLLACAIRQEAARKQGMFVFEGELPIVQLMARMSADPAERTEDNCKVLTGEIERRTVPMPEAKKFSVKIRKARQLLNATDSGSRFLSHDQSSQILGTALASLSKPLLPPSGQELLRQKFAADRRWVAERYAPEWLDQKQEDNR